MKIINIKILLRIIVLSIMFYFLNINTIYCSTDVEMQIINHSIENVIQSSPVPPISELNENDFFDINLSEDINTTRISSNTSVLAELNNNAKPNNNYLKYSIIGIFSVSLITGSIFLIKHFI